MENKYFLQSAVLFKRKVKLKTTMTALVSGDSLVHPGTELGDAGVYSRHGGGAGATAPGHNTNQGPGSSLLTDQGATRVTLQHTDTQHQRKAHRLTISDLR